MGVAVKSTDFPEQTVVFAVFTITEGVSKGWTVMVISFEIAFEVVKHEALLVITQLIISLFVIVELV